ncbi:MAG: hypothetical protein GY799_21155 [Desulfobulbaceae bacterium]|nr:hypothetical protein [Desulfobulbaceae bacterium]
MLLNKYNEMAATTAIYDGRGTYEGLTYVMAGLASEIGEVFGVLKKAMRDEGMVIPIDQVKKEIGDVMWYWSSMLFECSVNIEGDVDVDASQASIYEKFLDGHDQPAVDADMIFTEIGLMSTIQSLSSLMWTEYANIAEADIQGPIDNMRKLLPEMFRLLSIVLANLGVTVSECMEANLEKLGARKAAGKIGGSGEELDERR